MENWKPVVGFEQHYQVSDLGNVRTLKTMRIKKATLDKLNGRASVLLWVNNKYRCIKVHRLVLEAFIGRCPDGMEGCHNDGNSSNNQLSNLRWDTHINNLADKISHGTTNRGERCGTSKLTLKQVEAIRKDPRTQKEISVDYGIRQGHVSRIKNFVRWAYD